MTFNFYSSGTCTGTPVAQTGVSVSGSSATSSTRGPLAAGSYSFNAQYIAGSDPDHNNSAVSDCEPFVIDKAQLTTSTQVHSAAHADVTGGHVPLGSVVHDTAKVAGGVAGFPTAPVTFALYTTIDCTGSSVAVANTGADEGDATAVRSAASAALGAGSYSYKGAVAGDGNYLGDDSDCEPFTVDKAQLTTSTQVHSAAHANVTGGHVPLGSVVHDTAKVAGGVAGFPTAPVTFALYTTIDCTGSSVAVANTGADEGDATAVRSAASAALGAGSYSYKGAVAGDGNYVGDDSDCEPFTVDKAQLTVNTKVHDSVHSDVTNTTVPLGSVVHDTAKLTGDVAGFAAPPITFTFYSTTDCTGTGTAVANVGADQGDVSAVRSAASAALGAGAYSYKGSVAGNANYLGDDSDCEPFAVGKTTPGISTVLHNAATNAVVAEGSHLPLNTSMYDVANLTNDAGFPFTGSVTFKFFSTIDCTGTAMTEAGVAVAGLSATSSPHPNLPAGDYSFNAQYLAGADTQHNSSAVSSCEPFHIDKAQLTVGTKVHDSAHADRTGGNLPPGSVVHDTAKVTGVVPGFDTPPVTFSFYANDACTGEGTPVTNTGADQGDATAVRSAASAALGAGKYSYKGAVADNGNYVGDNSDCEPFTVVDARITIGKGANNKVGDAAHVHGHRREERRHRLGACCWSRRSTRSSTGVGSITGGTCGPTGTTNASGKCTVIVNSNVAGPDDGERLRHGHVGGVSVPVATNGYGAHDISNVKTWVDARITIGTAAHEQGR